MSSLVDVATLSDPFTEWIRSVLRPAFEISVEDHQKSKWETSQVQVAKLLTGIERLIEEHRAIQSKKTTSRLKQICPSVQTFFTPLKLLEAFQRYDKKYRIMSRNFVYPSSNEVRHILNLAQVLAFEKREPWAHIPDMRKYSLYENPPIQLVCFDGDQTLYSDGMNFSDQILAQQILGLMENGVRICLVTAANYQSDGAKYERRLKGLLKFFEERRVSEQVAGRFYVVGGQCNYLMRLGISSSSSNPLNSSESSRFQLHPEKTWQGKITKHYDETCIQQFLDRIEKLFKSSVKELNMKAKVYRGETSVGVFPCDAAQNHSLWNDTLANMSRQERSQYLEDRKTAENAAGGGGKYYFRKEQLDELCYRAKALAEETFNSEREMSRFPYNCFNGGNDVWFDSGNKKIGIENLQKLFNIKAEHSLHVGDQMLETGNDVIARRCTPCVWIESPAETKKILRYVLEQITGEKYGGMWSTLDTRQLSPGLRMVAEVVEPGGAGECILTPTSEEGNIAIQEPRGNRSRSRSRTR